MKFKKVGLVLGGGGGKGSYQVGVYKYLHECGISKKIKCISSNSIGSLNLSLLASGNVKQAEEVWKNMTRKKILTPRNLKEVIFGQGKRSLLSRKGMQKEFEQIDLNSISNLDIDMFVSTYNNNKKEGRMFKINGLDSDKIMDIISASSAIPVVFQPVLIDGDYYSDGFRGDNLPVQKLVEEGCDLILVIPLGDRGLINSTSFPDTRIIDFVDESIIELGYWDGTFGFDDELSTKRIDLGYKNAKVIIDYLIEKGYFSINPFKRFKNWFSIRFLHKEDKFKKYYSIKEVMYEKD